MAVGNKAEGGRDRENQACKRLGRARDQACKVAQEATAEAQEDTGVAREGEDTPDLDLGDQGDSEVTTDQGGGGHP